MTTTMSLVRCGDVLVLSLLCGCTLKARCIVLTSVTSICGACFFLRRTSVSGQALAKRNPEQRGGSQKMEKMEMLRLLDPRAGQAAAKLASKSLLNLLGFPTRRHSNHSKFFHCAGSVITS